MYLCLQLLPTQWLLSATLKTCWQSLCVRSVPRVCTYMNYCSLTFSTGTTHSFSEEEKLAFCDWINYQLEEDADLKNHLPISEEGNALFEALYDGIILW